MVGETLERPVPRTTVLVAIVNYCTANLTIDCLRSIETEISQYPGSRVAVADNASPDGSGALIARAIGENGWTAWATSLAMPRNGGFAYGNNGILRNALAGSDAPTYIWLLNSDTVLRPGAMGALIEYLESHPDVGIAGSCLEDPDGTQQCSAFRFHTITGEFEGAARIGALTRLLGSRVVAPVPERRSANYDWVSGASMMLRTDTLRQVGLMDEAYFLYYEETDLCRRARQYGWTCAFVGESRVVHLVGASTGVTDRSAMTRRRSAYWFESRRLYFIKNHGRLYAIGADAALALGTLIDQIRCAILRRPANVPERFLSDLARHSAIWPGSNPNGRSP
jgi:N-acetylglucosaminyl-diphospho-decaprenol L-rhamnosyltransferase